MCFIEKLSDFFDICSSIPRSSNTRIDDTMPDLYSFIGYLRIMIISRAFFIIDKCLIHKINIRKQTRKRSAIFVNKWHRNITDEYSTNQCGSTIFPISLIVEFFIFLSNCSYRSTWCDHEYRSSNSTKI